MRWFLEGGFFMWPVVLIFLVGGFLGLVRAALAKKAEFPGAGLNLAALLLGTGVVGTLLGWQQVFRVVAFVEPASRAEIVAVGMNEAWHPTTLAMVFVALLAPLALIAMARAYGRVTTLVKVVGLGSGLLSFSCAAFALLICAILSTQIGSIAGGTDATSMASATQLISWGLWGGVACAALGALIGLFGGLVLLPVGAVAAWKHRKDYEF